VRRAGIFGKVNAGVQLVQGSSRSRWISPHLSLALSLARSHTIGKLIEIAGRVFLGSILGEPWGNYITRL